MKRIWIALALSLQTLWFGCAGEVSSDESSTLAEETEVEPMEALSSHASALMQEDAPGPGGCAGDCMDICNADGKHFSTCQTHCKKACTAASAQLGGSGSSNQICKTGNKVFEGACKASGVLGIACGFWGGCSGCRKAMDANC